MVWTTRGLYRRELAIWRGAAFPTQFYLALVTGSPAPTAATVLFSSLTQIAVGNGYANGGYAVARNATDWPSIVENAGAFRVESQLKDIPVTGSGGNIPSDLVGAAYAVLLDDNATVGSREVWQFWPLGGALVVSDGQTLTLDDFKSYARSV